MHIPLVKALQNSIRTSAGFCVPVFNGAFFGADETCQFFAVWQQPHGDQGKQLHFGKRDSGGRDGRADAGAIFDLASISGGVAEQ